MSDAFTNPSNKLQDSISQHAGGADGWSHRTTTATVAIDEVKNTVSNTASTDYTLTLPNASTVPYGRVFDFIGIEDLGTGVVTISGAGAFRNFTHKMGGTSFFTTRVAVRSNGYDWEVLTGTRVVNDNSMDATPGYVGETVWNLDDTIEYTCSVASTTPSGAATWVANT